MKTKLLCLGLILFCTQITSAGVVADLEIYGPYTVTAGSDVTINIDLLDVSWPGPIPDDYISIHIWDYSVWDIHLSMSYDGTSWIDLGPIAELGTNTYSYDVFAHYGPVPAQVDLKATLSGEAWVQKLWWEIDPYTNEPFVWGNEYLYFMEASDTTKLNIVLPAPGALLLGMIGCGFTAAFRYKLK